MRVKIVVTDNAGQTYEGEADLAPVAGHRGGASRARATSAPATGNAKIDFGLPRRAFLKRHATGGGPQRFAVLLAHMTGGKTGVEVARGAVERAWGRNKGVLGGVDYHPIYATRATGNGWTDSPKRGTFVLRADWRGALK
jgi:hypothetical protein